MSWPFKRDEKQSDDYVQPPMMAMDHDPIQDLSERVSREADRIDQMAYREKAAELTAKGIDTRLKEAMHYVAEVGCSYAEMPQMYTLEVEARRLAGIPGASYQTDSPSRIFLTLDIEAEVIDKWAESVSNWGIFLGDTAAKFHRRIEGLLGIEKTVLRGNASLLITHSKAAEALKNLQPQHKPSRQQRKLVRKADAMEGLREKFENTEEQEALNSIKRAWGRLGGP